MGTASQKDYKGSFVSTTLQQYKKEKKKYYTSYSFGLHKLV